MAKLYRRKNGVFYEITRQDGRQKWRSTGARTLVEARKVVECNFTAPPPKLPDLTLCQFTPQFLNYAKTNFAPGTVLLYEQAVRTMKRLVGDLPLKNYTIQDVEAYKAKRLAEVSPVKVNIDFRTLRAYFQTAVRWKLISENPFVGSKQIRVPPKRPTYLSQEALQVLLGKVSQPWFKNVIMFAICTMMRAGEIVSLNWNSIDLGRKLIFVENTKEFRTKTLKPRTMPMNEWVYRYIATRVNKTGNVFTFPNGKPLTVGYVSHRFKKYVIASGLPNELHFHSLRHTGATWLVQGGVSIYAVQKLLGHASISTTQVYSHLETESLFHLVDRIDVSAPSATRRRIEAEAATVAVDPLDDPMR